MGISGRGMGAGRAFCPSSEAQREGGRVHPENNYNVLVAGQRMWIFSHPAALSGVLQNVSQAGA